MSIGGSLMNKVIISLILPITLVTTSMATAKDSMSFNYDMAEVREVIADYAEASGETFVVDPGVRGKLFTKTRDEVSLPEAFHLLLPR